MWAQPSPGAADLVGGGGVSEILELGPDLRTGQVS